MNFPYTGQTRISPLQLAICKDTFYTAQNLIEFGADLNFADENGVTPAMYAAKYVSGFYESCHYNYTRQYLKSKTVMYKYGASKMYTAKSLSSTFRLISPWMYNFKSGLFI